MPRVADFRVVNDHPRRLVAGEEAEFACEIPPNVSHSSGDPKSYVLLKFKLEGASALSWELRLGGKTLLITSGSGSNLITTTEAFEASLLLPGENTFTVRVTQGIGAIRIEDMVVHFHTTI